MLKKILFISLTLGLAFAGTTSKCFAGPSEQLEQAQNYQDKGYISQAETIYNQIVTDYPGTDYAFKAYKSLALSYIHTKQKNPSTQTINTLLTDYSAHADLPAALYDFACTCEKERAYDQAKSLYEELRRQFPGSPYADSAIMGISKANIFSQVESSRYAAAEAAINTLIADFDGHSNLPNVLCDFARRYVSRRKYKKAKSIYQLVVQKYPGTPYADESQLDMAKIEVMSLIRGGFLTQANSAVNSLCQDFATNPDLPKALYVIAGRYRGWAKYDEAINLYQKVIETYSNSSYVDKARLAIARSNVLALIKKGKGTESIQAFDKMREDFAGHMGLLGALKEIAKHYKQAEQYSLAGQVYSKITADYPGSGYALDAQKHLICIQIKAEQFTQAEQAITALSQDFAGHSDLPQALNDIAKSFNSQGKHQQAQALYQQITQQYPDSIVAEEARLNIPLTQILVLIDAEDHEAAFTAIEQLNTDFNGNWHLPWALAWLADQYCTKAVNVLNQAPNETEGYFQKAITLYEKVTNQFPNTAAAPKALCGLGNCYRKKADYEKAQQSYTKVVNDYGESNLAWHALYLKARTYEDMGKVGSLDQQEALVQAKASYQQLLQKYPNCKVAATVQNWLTRHGSN